SVTLLLYPFALALFVVFLLGITFAVSAVTVFYKDVQQIVEIVIYALFWLTPIVYSMDQITGKLRGLILLNPVAHYIELFHNIVYWGRAPSVSTWGICSLLAVVSLGLGVFCFRGLEQKFVEEL
ncbi:MAG: ABC transporter permease, partial [Deltaproteobacteria bacterium]|nr:ABC transporter permease [Deltaproteobacteria bacterium]